jgi:hypothetical protein
MKKLANTSTKKSDTVEIDPSFMPVVAIFADDPLVRRGKLFSSSSVLTVNGKVFAMLVKGRFVAKLPRGRVDELVSGGRGEYFDPGHGRLMKEWVTVEAGKPAWVALAKEAYSFVKGAKR